MKFKTGDNVKLIINPENEKYFTKHMGEFDKNKIYEVLGNNGSDCIKLSNGRQSEMINQDRYELAYKIHPRLIAEVKLHDPLAADYMEDWTGHVRDYNADELCRSIEWADTIQGNAFWNILDSKVGKVDLNSPMPKQTNNQTAEILPDRFAIHCTTIEQIDKINEHYDSRGSSAIAGKDFASTHNGKSATIYISKKERIYYKTGWNKNKSSSGKKLYEYAEWIAIKTGTSTPPLIAAAPSWIKPCEDCSGTSFDSYSPSQVVCTNCGQLKDLTSTSIQDLQEAGKEIPMSPTTTFVTETNHFINEMNVDSMNEDQFLASIVACEEKIANLKALGTQTKAVKAVIKNQEKCLDNVAKHFDERFGK